MNIKIGSLKEKILYLLVFGCLFCSSMYMYESYSGYVSSIILLIFSFAICLIKIKYLGKSQLINCMIVLIVIACSMVFNRSFESIDFHSIIIVVAAFFVMQSFLYVDFLKKYVDCILFIALFSIAVYFLYIIAPALFNSFSRHLWRNESVLFVNLWFAVVPVSMNDYFRNFGIFYEPGIFQFYLNTALIIELFLKGNINIARIIIFTTAIITTLSTSGYISLVLILFVYGVSVITGTGKKKGLYRKVIFLSVVAILLLIFIALMDRGIIGSRVFSKFSATRESGSFYDRTNAIGYAISKINKNPLLGVAARGIADSYNATFTPLNWMMLYGIVIEIFSITGFYRFFSKLAKKKWLKIGIAIGAFSSIITQDLSFEWIIWCFIFAGLKNDEASGFKFKTERNLRMSKTYSGNKT